MFRSAPHWLALSLLVVSLAETAQAGDWTDTDCTRWIGTPQYADCARAFEQLANSDCSQWTRGGAEFVKCQHARNVLRVQRCQAAGEARREAARNVGWDGVATVACPLINEQTGEEAAGPGRSGRAPRTGRMQRMSPAPATVAAKLEARPSAPSGDEPATRADAEPTQPRSEPARTGPMAWSNIRPPDAD